MSSGRFACRWPPLAMLVPTLVLAAATVWFGIDTELSAGIARQAAEVLLSGPMVPVPLETAGGQ